MRDDWNDLQAESSSIQWWRTFQEIWLQKLFENLRIWPLCESKPDGKPAVPGELLRHISGFNRVLTELVAYRNVIWTIAADIFFLSAGVRCTRSSQYTDDKCGWHFCITQCTFVFFIRCLKFARACLSQCTVMINHSIILYVFAEFAEIVTVIRHSGLLWRYKPLECLKDRTVVCRLIWTGSLLRHIRSITPPANRAVAETGAPCYDDAVYSIYP